MIGSVTKEEAKTLALVRVAATECPNVCALVRVVAKEHTKTTVLALSLAGDDTIAYC